MKEITLLFISLYFLAGCNSRTSNITSSSGDTASNAPVENVVRNKESIYVIPDTFQTQHNNKILLSSLVGKPTIVAMIFTHCTYACPRLTADMKNIADSLKNKKDKVNFVLITFDIERDTPEALQKFQKQMLLDENWLLLRGNEGSVRTLSVLLNVQYDKDAEGNFSHSNLISVLDKNGAVQFQKEGLQAEHAETIAKINELLEK